jgi:hypothetical protein
MDPTTIAAIIGAATAAASTATSEISKSVAGVGSAVGAVVINKSVHSFDVNAYGAIHGSWMNSPVNAYVGHRR